MAAALALGAVLMAPAVVGNGELYWHIAAGRWMIENQAVLRIDPFSYTFAGHPWHSQEWLSQLALTGAYLGTGFAGMLALAALVTGISAGLMTAGLARYWSGVPLAAGLVLCTAVLAGVVSATPYLLALPFVITFVMGLVCARAEGRRPAYYLLLPMLAWANLDASFVFGLLICLALAVEAMLAERSLAGARDWLVFAGYALVVSFITPFGVEGLVLAIRALALPAAPVSSLMPLLVALPAFAFLLRKQAWMRALSVAVLFVFALYFPAARAVLAVAAPLLVAPLFEGERRRFTWGRPVFAFAALALMGAAVRAFLPLDPGDSPVRPALALAAVPDALQHAPVLNEAAFGGYLVANDIRPFIDTRPIYTPRFRSRYDQLGDPAILARVLSRHHIRWSLLAPANPAVKTLDGMAGWKRIYSGPNAVVHVKTEDK